MQKELKNIFEEDQQDRKSGRLGMDEIEKRDAYRRARVREILTEAEYLSPEDYYHAALIFQHGNAESDYRKAIELVQRSMEGGFLPARRLYATATDRLLTAQSKPQKFGTQWRKENEQSPWELLPVDTSTTDEERAEYNVPPLQKIQEQIEKMNKGAINAART